MIRLSKILFLLVVLSGCHAAIDIQKYFRVCDRNALDVNDCMEDAVRKGIAAATDGIPDLDVPPIDPYLQKDFKLDYNNNQLVAKIIMKNLSVLGMKEAIVHETRLRADDDKFHLEIDMTSPKISIFTDYRGEGQFNALKIAASGKINTTMTDLTFTWKLDGVPTKIDGVTYMRIKNFYMRPDVGNMYVSLTNENPESKELTDLGLRFAKENWRMLYKELLPFAQANWKQNGIRIANKIFLKVPYDQLFPSS